MTIKLSHSCLVAHIECGIGVLLSILYALSYSGNLASVKFGKIKMAKSLARRARTRKYVSKNSSTKASRCFCQLLDCLVAKQQCLHKLDVHAQDYVVCYSTYFSVANI